jgi:hypothetical protein
MRGTFGLKWADLASFGRFQSIFFNDLGVKHLAPKAGVRGSNPFGCAIFSIGYRCCLWAVVCPDGYGFFFRFCTQYRASLKFRKLGFCSNRG